MSNAITINRAMKRKLVGPHCITAGALDRGRRCSSLVLAVAVVPLAVASAARAQDLAQLPEPLQLEQVMQHAREHRAEIAAAQARVRAAGQRPAVVSALEDPVIFPSVDHLPFELQGVNGGITVEQRFPLSRIRGHRQRAAEAEADRLRADVGRAELDVELEAANAFLMLRERRQTQAILREQHAFAVQLVRAALARFSTGGAGEADVLRAQIEEARLNGALRSIDAEVQAAEAMFNTSLARAVDAPVPALDNPATVSVPSPASAREAAIAHRPELRAALAEISRAEAEVSVMRSMYSPMAMVRTGPSYNMADGAGWMLMVGISIPLWRGKLKAGVSEAEAMAEMSRADLRAMRRMIEGEAMASRELVVAAYARVLALRDDIIPRAQQAIDPTLAGYSAGQLPVVSIIETARALWVAQGELVMAEYSLGAAQARLRRATGGGD